jgi:hypothetical protein
MVNSTYRKESERIDGEMVKISKTLRTKEQLNLFSQ